MAVKANEHVRGALEDSLGEFCPRERIEPDGGAVIRSAFKQFHHGGEYAKGRGLEFEVPPPSPPPRKGTDPLLEQKWWCQFQSSPELSFL